MSQRSRLLEWVAVLMALACDPADEPTLSALGELPALEGASRPAAFLGLPASASVMSKWSTAPVVPHLSFNTPVFVAEGPGTGRLFVIEREGRIFSVDVHSADAEKRLVLDLSHVTQGHGDLGMLGLAFHPDFGRAGSPHAGSIFVHYAHSDHPQPDPIEVSAPSRWRLVRVELDTHTGVADPGSLTVLIDQDDEDTMHAGGSMFFHPSDGFLYVTVGDEGTGSCMLGNCQRIDRDLYGGVLRIDVDMRGGTTSHPIPRQPESGHTANYYIPSDNPFVGRGGVLEEFYALGLRSPHRMSYDAVDDIGWLGDVGQARVDELDVLRPGANYQWDVFEGSLRALGDEPAERLGEWTGPVLELSRDEAHAVIGGGVYRGQRFPELWGKYIFGDFHYGNVWALSYEKTGGGVRVIDRELLLGGFLGRLSTITGFGFDAQGEIYLTAYGEGSTLHRLVLEAAPANLPERLSDTGVFADTSQLELASGLMPYTLQSPLWSDGATKRRWVSLPEGSHAAFSETGPWRFPEGTVFVKHFEMALDERRRGPPRRLETRLLVAAEEGRYYGITYKWNEASTDAVAVLVRESEVLEITGADGVTREQTYVYPGPDDCLVCHNADAGHVLGVRTAQLNADVRYGPGAPSSDQLWTWSELGLLDVTLGPDSSAEHASLAPLADEERSIEDRVRSYWDSNCSMCHGVVDGLRATWDARYDTPLSEQGVIGAAPFDADGSAFSMIVAPGDPEASLLYQRDRSVAVSDRMPPLGRTRADEAYLRLLERWILALTRS